MYQLADTALSAIANGEKEHLQGFNNRGNPTYVCVCVSTHLFF
jgi:hypothetical protein